MAEKKKKVRYYFLKKKVRLENMAKRIIRAPAKILYGLRFKNRCIHCGRVIPPDRMVCNKCSRKKILCAKP